MLENLVDVETSDPEAEVAQDEAAAVSPAATWRERLNWREYLRGLDERYPRVSQWLGGRLDIEVPAIAVSLGAHLALITSLGMVGYAVKHEADRRFEASTVVDTKVDLDRMTYTDQNIDQDDKPPVEQAAGSFSPKLATVTVNTPMTPSGGSVPSDLKGAAPTQLAKLDVQNATNLVVPTASMYSQTVSIKGSGSEHVGSAEGAVDRIADEVLRRLEKGRTLVVWAFDASGSLVAERERLSKHIDVVYKHINQLDAKGLAGNGGLMTAVVAFGNDRKLMTAAPTDDNAAISSAIQAVPLDETGNETTFTTVADIVRKWGRYKDAKGNAYKTIVIVVTDEVGDDEDHLEEAIEVATKAKVPVFVLGSQAIFARTQGYQDYTHPKTKQFYRNVAVRQGPESIMPEQIRVPYWYDGDQYDVLDSGFGPYALSRLAGATGGIYFVTRMGHQRMGFDQGAMQEYKPDWLPRGRYEAEVLSHPIRKAVIEAAMITQQNNLPGMPSLSFPPVDGPEFKQVMETNQAQAARTAYTVDAALEPIKAVSKLRDRETSRRWQAHYDLISGRLWAMKVRCYEYNWACAKMKKDAPKFTKPDSNTWRLVPDSAIHMSDKAADAGKMAIGLLKRVVAEHPNTPWALLAQRELKDPLGFKWTETHVKPIVRNDGDADEAKKKKQKPTPPPPPPPKI